MTAGTPHLSTATSTWRLWSTEARLVVTDPAGLDAARELVDGWLDEVDQAANRFRDDSEVRGLADHDGRPTRVSETFAYLLERALTAAALTDGDVDPTVGTAMRRIGYDRDLRLVLDDDRPVKAVIGPVPGYRSVHLHGRELTVPAGVELDLGATAKAVAADRAAALVHDTLGIGALVSLGGDIATAGPVPPEGWQILVQDRPEDPSCQVRLGRRTAIATSSTVARQWHRGGRALHHVIDPRSGQPARRVWRTVTVAGPSCLIANAITTAAIVRGAAAPRWVAELGLPARFVRDHGSTLVTDAWPRGDAA